MYEVLQAAVASWAHNHLFRLRYDELKLDKVHDDFEVEVVADVEHHAAFVAKAHDTDLYACIDAVVDKAVRQLHDWKEKISDHKSH